MRSILTAVLILNLTALGLLSGIWCFTSSTFGGYLGVIFTLVLGLSCFMAGRYYERATDYDNNNTSFGD